MRAVRRSGMGNWAGLKSPIVRLQTSANLDTRSRTSAAILRVSLPMRPRTIVDTRVGRARRRAGSSGRGQLPQPSVPKRHALLAFHRGVWTLTDLESTSGTWVAGRAARGPAPSRAAATREPSLSTPLSRRAHPVRTARESPQMRPSLGPEMTPAAYEDPPGACLHSASHRVSDASVTEHGYRSRACGGARRPGGGRDYGRRRRFLLQAAVPGCSSRASTRLCPS